MAGKVSLRLHNSLSGEKEEFRPMRPGVVAIYSCGPTVYDFAHIGNFRAFLFVDLLRRYLLYRGYSLRHAINLTDVEDKIIQRAAEKGQSIQEYTAPYIEALLADLRYLGVSDPEFRPRATEHIADILSLIEDLQRRQHTYDVEGSVYFKVNTFAEYGRLSRIDPEKLRTAADGRFDADEYTKEDVRDFALWKASRPGEGAAWPSPWGQGRPGWHIECSAMIRALFGAAGVDIHTGGIDLLFPHHENEIAQSRCADPEHPFVRYWLHNEHLLVDGRKMSKSLGNVYTLLDFRDRQRLAELVEKGAPEELLRLYDRGVLGSCLRYVLLTTHYRQKLNFTFEGLLAAEHSILRIRRLRERLAELSASVGAAAGDATPEAAYTFEPARQLIAEFVNALDDDLNISRALAAVFECVRRCNLQLETNSFSASDAAQALHALQSVDRVFDLLADPLPAPTSEPTRSPVLVARVQALLQQRAEARQRKDFAESDRLRDELSGLGVVVKDTAQGAVWEWL